jgi:hypothetical protein
MLLPATLAPSSSFPNDQVVFAQTQAGVFKSVDGASSFERLKVVGGGADVTLTPQMAVAPGYREAAAVRTLLVAVFQVSTQPTRRTSGGIFRSDNGGATWRTVSGSSALAKGASAVGLAPDGRIFAGYSDPISGRAGLLCSVDGTTWAALCPADRGPDLRWVAIGILGILAGAAAIIGLRYKRTWGRSAQRIWTSPGAG